jgi:hypothetical protein
MPNSFAGWPVRRHTASAQRQLAALAHPVAEQVQAEAGVVEEREVRAGVGQRDQARRVAQHARRPRLVGVEQQAR